MELSIHELARAPAMIELLQAAFDPDLEVELELVQAASDPELELLDAPEARPDEPELEALPSVIIALDAPAEQPPEVPDAPEVPALADSWFDEFDESDAAMVAALDAQGPPERRAHPLVRWLFGRFTTDRAAALAR